MLSATEMRIALVSDDICSAKQTRFAWETAERRGTYLLRADVDVPLSADPRVTIRTATREEDSWRIIVTAHEDDQESAAKTEFEGAFGSFFIADPNDLQGASFLGFDVCDRNLYSALLNCGYTDEFNRSEAQKRWTSKLTEHHLLRELADARALRKVTDVRVASHAPFYVLRVYGKCST